MVQRMTLIGPRICWTIGTSKFYNLTFILYLSSHFLIREIYSSKNGAAGDDMFEADDSDLIDLTLSSDSTELRPMSEFAVLFSHIDHACC